MKQTSMLQHALRPCAKLLGVSHESLCWRFCRLVVDTTANAVVCTLAQAVGVELNKKGAIVVDKYSHTNVDSIWAIGVSVAPR